MTSQLVLVPIRPLETFVELCTVVLLFFVFVFFFFTAPATTEIYTLSLHDALPISIPGINANVGAFQTYANTSITTINNNITGANASISTLSSRLDSVNLAQTAALTANVNLKADLAGPTFTGTPVAPTPTFGANTTQVATAQYVMTRGVFWDGSRKFVSTADPTVSDGADGDLWFKYTS